MAKAKNITDNVPAEEKIARLLGLLVVKNVEQKTERVTLLRAAGFPVADIAAMLGMTENHVAVAAYEARKKKPQKRATKR